MRQVRTTGISSLIFNTCKGLEDIALKKQNPKVMLGKGQPPCHHYDSFSLNKLVNILE